jgi:phosphatidate phosphatase APP1
MEPLPLLVKFTELHHLPKAVLLLKDIKTSLFDFMDGRGGHNHKFDKINTSWILSKFTLIGDDSQHDPQLYEAIAKIFPLTVKAVYIRQTWKDYKPKSNYSSSKHWKFRCCSLLF